MARGYEGSTYTREEAIARSLNDLDPTQEEGKDVLNKEEGETISPQPIEETRPKKQYTEQQLLQALKSADQSGDNAAATVIANRIMDLRNKGVPSQKGGYAASTDIIDPSTRSVREQGNAAVRAGLTAGWQQTFMENWGRNLQVMMDADSWTNVRFMAINPKTGEREIAQSTASWIGMSDQEWNDNTPEQRRVKINSHVKEYINKEYQPNRTGAAFNIAKFGGMLMDPTTAAPLTGGPVAMMLKGSALGSADMAGYGLAQEGKIDPAMVALGAGLGSIPGVIKGGYRGTKAAKAGITRQLTPKVRREAMDKLEAFEQLFQKNRKKFDNHTTAYMKSLESAGINDDVMNQWIKQSGSGKSFQKTRDVANSIFEPISDRIRKKSVVLHKNLMDMERGILETSHKAMAMSDPFLNTWKKVKKRAPLEAHALKKAMLNSDGTGIEKLIRENIPDSKQDYETYRLAMKDMWKLVSDAREGLIGKEVEHYTHRAVKDYKAIRNWLMSKGNKADVERIDKLLKNKFKGRNATEQELNSFYSNYLDGIYDSKKIKLKPGAAKGRRLKVVPDELVQAFHDPDVAAHTYVRSMTEDAYQKSLFGKEIVTKYGDNLTDNIAAFVQKEHQAGRMNADDIDEIKTLLELRFHDGLKKPNEVIQKFKDYSYSMLLGNPISAITQLGDVFLASWKVGFRNSMAGLSKAVSGRGLSPKEFGLMDSMLEEMVSTGKSKKWLRRSLKYGGFQKIDQIGKATLMNGSLRRYTNLAKTEKGIAKLKKQWGEAYGKDFNTLISELQDVAKGKPPSGNIKTLIFADLADVQPITLLEMPEQYLKNPNGRIFYMLRTFQLKYMNLLRKTMIEGYEKGNRTKALTSGFGLMAMFTAGGITSDMLKHAVLSRDPNIDNIVVDNILANTGIFHSRYDAGKLIGKKPLSSIAGQLVPPVGIFDPFAYAFTQRALGEEVTMEDKGRMMGKIPVVGRLLENYGFGGRERFADKEFKESIKIDLDIKPIKL